MLSLYLQFPESSCSLRLKIIKGHIKSSAFYKTAHKQRWSLVVRLGLNAVGSRDPGAHIWRLIDARFVSMQRWWNVPYLGSQWSLCCSSKEQRLQNRRKHSVSCNITEEKSIHYSVKDSDLHRTESPDCVITLYLPNTPYNTPGPAILSSVEHSQKQYMSLQKKLINQYFKAD